MGTAARPRQNGRLLRKPDIVDHQKSIRSANKTICLAGKFLFKRSSIPNTIGNEMMKTVVLSRSEAGGHRFDRLAITRPDQTSDVKWAHLTPPFVAKPINKRPA